MEEYIGKNKKKVKLYFDCRRFENESKNTKVCIFDSEHLVAEKFLRGNSIGTIELIEPISRTLKFHFEFAEKFHLKDSEYLDPAYEIDLAFEKNEEDCLDEAVFLPERWIFAYDSEISFINHLPENIYLTFSDDYVGREVFVCVPVEEGYQVRFIRNIEIGELKKTRNQILRKMIVKMGTILTIGFILFQLLGAMITAIFSDTLEHKSSLYYILLILIILPVMFLTSELSRVLKMSKTISKTSSIEFVAGGDDNVN